MMLPSRFRGYGMEISQEVVESDLASYLPDLRCRVARALADYTIEYAPKLRRVHSKRTKASLVHDHIVEKMAEFAESTPGVVLRNCQNLWVLTFPQGYIVRFKKVGPFKLPSGHKTRQVRNFRNHVGLEGLPPAICLDLSYQLDESGDLHGVYLICPSGTSSNMWDSEITDDGARPIVVSLFGEQIEPQGATLQPRKRDKIRESESGDGNSSA